SRNQNHIEQTKIAKILAAGPQGITLMFKNQMWDDSNHWMGIYQHIVSSGFPKERLLACHRGFSPGKLPNPKSYRNLPDYEMGMHMKQKMGLSMILDPSHIGGSRENVFDVLASAISHDFDGYIIEVHTDPENAKTDAKQQLSIHQLGELLKLIHRPVAM